jgi:hypothetical protein
MFAAVGGAAFTVDSTNWGMQSIQILDDIFSAAYSITTLDVTLWNTATLQTAARFVRLSSIITVDISSWTTSQMINFDSMFESTSTVVVGINTLNTASAMTTNNMFYRYSGSIIDVSGYDMDSVFSAGVMFTEYIQGPVNVATWNAVSLAFAGEMFRFSNSNPNIASWNVASFTSADHFISECFISQTNYDTVLVKLDSTGISSENIFNPRSNLIVSVPLPAAILQFYSVAVAAAHASLLGKGWTITDGGGI